MIDAQTPQPSPAPPHSFSSPGWSVFGTVLFAFFLTGLIPLVVALIEGKAFGAFPSQTDPTPHYAFFGPFFVWPITFLLLFPLVAGLIHSFYIQIDKTLHLAWRDNVLRSPVSDGRQRRQISALRKVSLLYYVLKIGAAITFAALTVFIYWFGTYPLLGFGSKGILSQTVCTGTWVVGSYRLPIDGSPGVSATFFAAMFAQLVIISSLATVFYDFLRWSITVCQLSSQKHGLRVEPLILHPDTAAGLSQFGRSCWRFYLILLALGFFVVFQMGEKILVYQHINNTASAACLEVEHVTISQLGGPSILWVLINYPAVPLTFLCLFLVIVPSAFLVPMLPLRKLLKQEKNNFRLMISSHLRDSVPDDIVSHHGYSDAIHFSRDNLANIEALRKLYDWIEHVPNWPFDRQTIKQFFYTYAVPFIAFLAQIVSQKLVGT